MPFFFRYFFLPFTAILLASLSGPRLCAQDDPSGSVPDDATTAMTTEQGDPIGTEARDNGEVPADPDYSPPQGPFVPDFPESSNSEGPVGVTGIFNGQWARGENPKESPHENTVK